jgi:hypothetical protein
MTIKNTKYLGSEWFVVLRQFNNCSAMSWREQVNYQWDDDEVRLVVDQHSQLELHSANSL